MLPSPLEGWDVDRCRAYLRTRAQMIRLNPKLRVRFDESDLVQETLLRAVDPATPPCRGQSWAERLAWLEQIQDNLFIDRYRAEHAGRRDLGREQDVLGVLKESTGHWHIDVADHRDAPPEEASRGERAVALAAAIQQLPEGQRDVVIALGLQQLRLEKAAELLDMTTGQVAGLYRRGVTKLRELLREHDDRR